MPGEPRRLGARGKPGSWGNAGPGQQSETGQLATGRSPSELRERWKWTGVVSKPHVIRHRRAVESAPGQPKAFDRRLQQGTTGQPVKI